MVNNPGKVAGQYAGLPGSFSIRLNKATGITVTRGVLCKKDTSTDPDSWVTTSAAADQYGPFAVPVETVGTGKLKFSARFNDVVYLTCDGVIEPGSAVQAATATAGQVISFTDATIAVTPTQTDVTEVMNERKRQVGICLGTAETWNTSAPAASADGDLVAVFVPGGGSY